MATYKNKDGKLEVTNAIPLKGEVEEYTLEEINAQLDNIDANIASLTAKKIKWTTLKTEADNSGVIK